MLEASSVRFLMPHIGNVVEFLRKYTAGRDRLIKTSYLNQPKGEFPVKLSKPSEDVTEEVFDSAGSYTRAIASLKESSTTLVYRDRELGLIEQFIANEDDTSRNRLLSISGVPGVGKGTAVGLCVKTLNRLHKTRLLDVSVAPNRGLAYLYSLILQKLVQAQTVIDEESQLDRLFHLSKLPFRAVLLVRNVDMLQSATRKELIAKLIKWMSNAGRRLSIVLTSTGVGFSQELKKASSNELNIQEVVFSAYNSNQLESIIVNKLRSYRQLIEQDTLKEACKHVAAKSSNVGRLVELCAALLTCAKDNYLEEEQYHLAGNAVASAEIKHLRYVIQPKWSEAIFACCPRIEKLTMVAIYRLLQKNPMAECYSELERLLHAMLRQQRLDYKLVDIRTVLCKLKQRKLLTVDEWYNPRMQLTDGNRLLVRSLLVQPNLPAPRLPFDPLIDSYLEELGERVMPVCV